jgi:transcriptional regulator with XRE-family HTH domain
LIDLLKDPRSGYYAASLQTIRFGERIRAMRLESGLSPAALAKKVGGPRQVIAILETGKIEPPTDLIEHILIALGRRLRDFAEAASGDGK